MNKKEMIRLFEHNIQSITEKAMSINPVGVSVDIPIGGDPYLVARWDLQKKEFVLIHHHYYRAGELYENEVHLT